MSGYTTQNICVHVGTQSYTIRALSDLQQFYDPLDIAEKAGISSALWSLFGQLWPAGKVLAKIMQSFDILDKRILEIGCGLGLASLVLQRRHANITASDHHPLAEDFLNKNTLLNNMDNITYCDLPWDKINTELGLFNVIIGSDILYEKHFIAPLIALLLRHSEHHVEFIITDPGRGNSNLFIKTLQQYGFSANEERRYFILPNMPNFYCRLIRLTRY